MKLTNAPLAVIAQNASSLLRVTSSNKMSLYCLFTLDLLEQKSIIAFFCVQMRRVMHHIKVQHTRWELAPPTSSRGSFLPGFPLSGSFLLEWRLMKLSFLFCGPRNLGLTSLFLLCCPLSDEGRVQNHISAFSKNKFFFTPLPLLNAAFPALYE